MVLASAAENRTHEEQKMEEMIRWAACAVEIHQPCVGVQNGRQNLAPLHLSFCSGTWREPGALQKSPSGVGLGVALVRERNEKELTDSEG